MEQCMEKMAIRTDGLGRDFGTVKAVDRISLEVPQGIIFGFLGPNGAGKTTTIRLLLGLLEASEGRAEVLEFDTRTHADEIRSKTGAMLEHTGLYERVSAEDNLEFYARIWHLSQVERQDRIKELLTHLGLWERRHDTVGKWSRGMKQKLAFARTLLHRPSLVFMDEPTAGLDPVSAAAMRDDLSSLCAREMVTVFLTTHNLTEAEKVCKLVGVIKQGKLLAVGSPNELRANSSAPRLEVVGRGFSEGLLAALKARPEVESIELQDHRLTIGLHNAVDTAPLVGLMVNAGAQVEEARKEHASLEDVFLNLMEEEK
jgi:ABC-2 type transport system ATP-binding protein